MGTKTSASGAEVSPRKRNLRRQLFLGLTVFALGALAAVIAWWPGPLQPASADFPHAGVGLSIGVGATCNSTAGPAECTFGPGATFTLDFRVDSLGDGFAYGGYDASIDYAGVTVKDTTLVQTGAGVWPGCVFNAFDFTEAGHIAAACAFGIGAQPATYTGVMMHVDFNCAASGTVTLLQGEGASDLVDEQLVPHGEASGSEVLTINCTETGGETPTNTPPAGPTSTPVGPTNTPGGPTNTPGGPTNTPAPPTPTRTPLPAGRGDVNGDHRTDSLDSLWILWQEAHIIAHVPLPENADLNHDGQVNSLDSLFVLWISSGQVS